MGLSSLLLHCLVILLVWRDPHSDLMSVHSRYAIVLLLHHEAVYLLRFLRLTISSLNHEVVTLRQHSLVVNVYLHKLLVSRYRLTVSPKLPHLIIVVGERDVVCCNV